MNNSIFVISPYRTEYGIWVFDDENVGLVAEPFVGEINPMLDTLTNGASKCVLFFSKTAIPSATLTLYQLRGDEYGTYYSVKEFDNAEIWLCPALFLYYKEAPSSLFVKVV